jgi:hypothetical protein
MRMNLIWMSYVLVAVVALAVSLSVLISSGWLLTLLLLVVFVPVGGGLCWRLQQVRGYPVMVVNWVHKQLYVPPEDGDPAQY